MILRDYQIEAAEYLATHRWALIKARPGSGKTVIAAAALRMVIQKRNRQEPPRIGWLCHTIEQKAQAEDALKKMGVKALVECAAANPDFSGMDCIVVDEAHHLPSPFWSGIVSHSTGARWMLSATPFKEEDDQHNAAMMNFCGGNVFEVCREKTSDHLAEARVIMLDESDECRMLIDNEIEAEMNRRRWQLRPTPAWPNPISEGELFARVSSAVCMQIGIIKNRIRNSAIIRTAREHREDSTLIIIHSIEHGNALAEHIPGAIPCSSKMGKKARSEAIEGFRDGSVPCLVATSLADEGMDVPRCNVVIMAGGGRSKNRAEQRTGRGLRAFQGKTHGQIYDFTDRQHRVLANQSKSRVELYRSLGYKFSENKQLTLG